MKMDENAFLVEEDYLVTCWEQPELIEIELRRFEKRRSILKRKPSAGYVVLVLATLALFWVDSRFMLAPLALIALNMAIIEAESRRLMQLRQLLVFIRETGSDERAGATSV